MFQRLVQDYSDYKSLTFLGSLFAVNLWVSPFPTEGQSCNNLTLHKPGFYAQSKMFQFQV